MTFEKKYYEMAKHKESKYDVFPRREMAAFLSNNLKSGSDMLDVGCGIAGVLHYIPAVRYTGIETSEFALTEARIIWKDREHTTFTVGKAYELPFESNRFDCVLMMYSLEHFIKPQEALKEAIRVLKPGGHLVIAAPSFELPIFNWPHPTLAHQSLRYKPYWYRLRFFLGCCVDAIGLLFGRRVFRTLSENYTSATGRFEFPDDDLWHVVSAWEVIGFLETNGMQLEKFWEDIPLASRRHARALRLIRSIPTLHYFGTPLVASFKKD
jgi:ubiquinone/menaquinone biosynthesis C-methylase UbiE